MSEDEAAHISADLEREVRVMSTHSVLISQATAERLRINASDLESLDFLNLYGPMTPGRLAELTGLSSGGVTRLVDRLVARGLVERSADPADRRRVILTSRVDEFPGIYALWEPLAVGFASVVRSFPDDQLKVVLDFVTRCNEVGRAHLVRLRNAAGDDAAVGDMLTSQPGDTRV
jgi:hypothetical protein